MTDCLQLIANGLLDGSNGSTIPAGKTKSNASLIAVCSSHEIEPTAEAKKQTPSPSNNMSQRATRSSTKSTKASKGSRNRGGIKRVIKATESSRQVMRQVSGLGMFDPVFGEEMEVHNPQHPSYFFDDMDAEAIPEGMREVLSCCSDHTADENDGIDMELFNQSLGVSHMSSFSNFSQGTASLKSNDTERYPPSHRSKACSRQQSMTSRKNKTLSTRTSYQDWHASVTTLDTLSLEDTVEKSAENVKRKKSSENCAGVDGPDTAKLCPSKSRGSSAVDKPLNCSTCAKKSAAKQNHAPSFHSPTQSQQEIPLSADVSPVKHRELPMCPEDIFGSSVDNRSNDNNRSNNKKKLDMMKSSGIQRLPKSPEKMLQTMASSLSQLDHLPDTSLFAKQPPGSKRRESVASGSPAKDKQLPLVSSYSMPTGGSKTSSPNRTRNESVSSKHHHHAKVQPLSSRKPTESHRLSTKKATSQVDSSGASHLSPKKQTSKQSISNRQQPQQFTSTSPHQKACNKANESAQTSGHSSRIFGLGGNKAKFSRLPSEHSFQIE